MLSTGTPHPSSTARLTISHSSFSPANQVIPTSANRSVPVSTSIWRQRDRLFQAARVSSRLAPWENRISRDSLADAANELPTGCWSMIVTSHPSTDSRCAKVAPKIPAPMTMTLGAPSRGHGALLDASAETTRRRPVFRECFPGATPLLGLTASCRLAWRARRRLATVDIRRILGPGRNAEARGLAGANKRPRRSKWNRPAPCGQLYREALDLVRGAELLGVDSARVTEHLLGRRIHAVAARLLRCRRCAHQGDRETMEIRACISFIPQTSRQLSR